MVTLEKSPEKVTCIRVVCSLFGRGWWSGIDGQLSVSTVSVHDFTTWWFCELKTLLTSWVGDCWLHEVLTWELLTCWRELTTLVHELLTFWVEDFARHLIWWHRWWLHEVTLLTWSTDGLHELICWLNEVITLLTSWGGDLVYFMRWWLDLSPHGVMTLVTVSWCLFWLQKVVMLLTSWVDSFSDFTEWWLCWLHQVMISFFTSLVDNFVDFIRWWLLTSRGEDAYTSQWYLVECSHAKLVVCEKWLSALRLQMTNRQYTQCNGQTCSRQPQALCLLTVLLLPAALRPCHQRKQLSVVISVASQVLSLLISLFLPSIVDQG